jgi:hypothetical protein
MQINETEHNIQSAPQIVHVNANSQTSKLFNFYTSKPLNSYTSIPLNSSTSKLLNYLPTQNICKNQWRNYRRI